MATTNSNPSFKAGDIEIRDGVLYCGRRSIPVNDIAVIFPIKSQEVKIMGLTEQKNNLIIKSVTEFDCKVPENQIPDLFKAVRDCGTAPIFSDRLKLVVGGDQILRPAQIDSLRPGTLPKQGSVWCYDDCAIIAGSGELKDLAVIKDIRFFKTTKEGALFGYDIRYEVPKLSQDAAAALKQEFIKLGAPIGSTEKGRTFEGNKPWFGLKFWVRDEKLTLTSDSIIFEYSKGKKTESIFLPVADITSVANKGSRLRVFGKQNILSKCKFSSEARKALMASCENATKEYTGKRIINQFKLLGIFPLWSRKKYGYIDYSSKGMIIRPSDKDLEIDKESKDPTLSMSMKVDMKDVLDCYRKKKNVFIVFTTGNVRELSNKEQSEGYAHYLAFKNMCGAKEFVMTVSNEAEKLNKNYSKDKIKDWAKAYKF